MGRYTGGIIKSTEFTTSRFGTNSGMFTLGQQLNATSQNAWPSDYDVVLQFSGSGDWTCPEGVDSVEYLVIGGGGSGAIILGGGGGAGGMRFGSTTVYGGKTYPIQFGGGGGTTTASGIKGSNSGFKTEANVLYYVAVGAAQSPGSGNRYYVKNVNEFEGATANVEAETLKLYEGSTYRFDQSHPTNSGHPFRFSSTVVSPASSATPYTTGLTTNQPSTGAGSPGSRVQLQVATPAPQLYYYCTSHPVSGSASMGGAADTLANISIVSLGGGGGGGGENSGDYTTGHKGGSGGGSGNGTRPAAGAATPVTQISGENTDRGSGVQGFGGGGGANYTAAGPHPAGGGGGGGASEPGTQASAAPVLDGGDGGDGQAVTISGTPVTYAGGGGGGTASFGVLPPGTIDYSSIGLGGLGGGGNGGSGFSIGLTGTTNTGGGGGGGGIQNAPSVDIKDGKNGGSGIILIKYKNNSGNKIFTFNASTTFKNNIGAKTADYLIVAGGGAGGYGNGGEGGGGAGGMRQGSGLPLFENEEIRIQVGSGGTGAGPADAATNHTKGNDSFISTSAIHIGSNGGGRAVSAYPINYEDTIGGSGGGGRYGSSGNVAISLDNTTFYTGSSGNVRNSIATSGFGITEADPFPLQGHAGGAASGTSNSAAVRKGGGGGGAGTVGQNGVDVSNGRGGNGGNAVASTITGSTVYYAGGGGGCTGTKVAVSDQIDICSLGGGTGGPLSGAGPGSANSPVYANKGGGGDGYDNKGPAPQYTSAPTNDGRTNTGGGGGAATHVYDASPEYSSGQGGSGIVVLKITG